MDDIETAAGSGNLTELTRQLTRNANTAALGDALFVAAVHRQTGAADLLLRHGADPNTRGEFGYTPLHVAAANGDPDLVLILLVSGAQVDALNDQGATPLHLLIEHAMPWDAEPTNLETVAAIAQTLIQHGADPMNTGRVGRTPLEVMDGVKEPDLEPLREIFRRAASQTG